MCHVHIYHNYIPPVICGTLVGNGPRIIKNLARHPTLVFACYGNDSKHKKYRYPVMCAMGHEAPQAGEEWMTCTQLMSHNYIQKENDANFSKET